MRNIHYNNKGFRLSEKVYRGLKNSKPQGASWNQFFLQLLETWEGDTLETKRAKNKAKWTKSIKV